MSMPTIAASKTAAPQIKYAINIINKITSFLLMTDYCLLRNLTSTLPASSMSSSPSFPAQLLSNKPAVMAAAPSNIPATQSSLNLNSNFLSGLGPMTNTAKRVPMNQMQMSTNTQPSFLSAQSSQFQNSANSLSTLSPIVTNQSNSAKRNGQDNTVALSAQEINDFLS